MKRRAPSKTAVARWARKLSARVERVLALHPEADPDNVRHTLILLELPPLERLQRSLIRGRAKKKLKVRQDLRRNRYFRLDSEAFAGNFNHV